MLFVYVFLWAGRRSCNVLRIHADENISAELVAFARKRFGWDVVYACEHTALCGRSDSFHFQEARRCGRLLLTRDKHFLDPVRFPHHKCLGIVVLEGTTTGELEKILVCLVQFLHSSPFNVETFSRFTKLVAARDYLRVRRMGPGEEIVEKIFPWLPDRIS
jgi:predicted nuclease of predicted toxin-antitoxin system